MLLTLLFVLAQDTSHPLNRNEFNPLLLGQLIQIITAVGGAIAVIWNLRRNPPLSEEVILLRAKVINLEGRVEDMEERLKEGDKLFREDAAVNATLTANVQTVKEELHLIKQKMDTVIAITSHSAHNSKK